MAKSSITDNYQNNNLINVASKHLRELIIDILILKITQLNPGYNTRAGITTCSYLTKIINLNYFI